MLPSSSSGAGGTSVKDRIYGNIVHVSIQTNGTDPNASSLGASNDALHDQMLEIDKFSWSWKATVDNNWPAGAPKRRNHFTDGPIEVQMTGGQVDVGFYQIVQYQRAAMKAGKQPVKFDILRQAVDANGVTLFTQKFQGGVATQASGDQSEGNKQLSNALTVSFDDMVG